MIDMMKYDDKEITGQVNMMWDKERKQKKTTKEEGKRGNTGVRIEGQPCALR